MRIGDLVRYECPAEPGVYRLGYITDLMEDNGGWYMYEVICTEPYDRNWFSDVVLELVSGR